MTNKKPKIIHQEKYKKGTVINNKAEIQQMIEEYLEEMTIYLIRRNKYDDGTESLVIEIRY